MKFNFESFPKNHLYKLLIEIIKKYDITSFDELKIELFRYKNDQDSENYNINIKEYDDICLFYTPSVFYNFHSTNILIDNMIHQLDTCILDKTMLLPIVYKTKHINHTTNSDTELDHQYNNNTSYISTLQSLNFLDDKNRVKIYNNYVGEYIVLFNNNNKWLMLHNTDIIDINKDKNMLTELFNNILIDKNIKLDSLDENNTYHFVIVHYRLNKCIMYPQWGNEFKELVLIKSEQKYTLIEKKVEHINCLIKNRQIYLSCLDELYMYLENLNYYNTIDRKLTDRGLLVSFFDKDNQQIYVNFNIKLYNKIHSYFVSHKNIHQIHLKLYQLNKCNDILPYISNNYIDIVRRINMSIKTLSKELLNIYFLTRNKQNKQLYDVLQKSYKNILFNMHRIFMKKKDMDIYNHDELIEKKSVTINNVYNYLKNMNNDELVKLYSDRHYIINYVEKIKDDTIMLNNCINTIMQTKLMES
jgi:hypothetical protein